MAELNFGSDSEGFARALEQMEQLEAAKAELDAKDAQLREGEEATTGAIIDNTSAIQRAIEQTRLLSQATQQLATGLTAEAEAVRTSTVAWEARVAVMREAAVYGSASTAGAARAAEAEGAAVAGSGQRRERRPPSAAPRTYEQLGLDTAVAAEQTGQLGLGGVVPEGQRRRPSAAPREPATETVVPTGGSARAAEGADAAATAFREQAAAEEEAAAAAQALVERQEQALATANELAAAQTRVNLAYNESVAAYAESSSVLSRNGALTTEFIQAFARGDVTLKEFSSQMTSTIGKFGGWAVAGGLVYGAFDAIKKLGEGAKDTQEGVQQLSRFIPTASTTQRGATESTFRNISQDLNVPISEVTSAMSVMARVFHDVADAGEAARAVLLAGRLDQIPATQGEQYLTGIAQSLNLTKGSELVGVVNSLNALQNTLGARVNQTLPALARAAPAAEAGGLSPQQLEALVAVGVRSGIPGTQVGTALLRSIGTFAFRPQSESVLRQYGFDPQRGHYGDLVNQITQRIVNPAPGKELTGQDLTQIAQALGGPLLGSRTLLPILEHANLLPGAQYTAAHPPSAQAELDKILGGVGEEFKKIGIVIENIGSELESAGLLEPIQVLLQGIGLLGQGIETLLSPVELVANAFGQLPGPMKDALGVIVGAAALRALSRSSVGFTAQEFIGRLPGLGGLKDDSRAAVQGTLSRYRTFQIPETERDLEGARQRTRNANRGVVTTRTAAEQDALYASANPADDTAKATSERSSQAYLQAQTRAATAASDQADIEAQLVEEKTIQAVLESDRVSIEQKLNYLLEQQLAVVGEQSGIMTASMRSRVAASSEAAIIAAKGASGPSEEGFGGTEAAGLAGAGLVASTAFQQATPQEQAAIIGATADVEQPGLMEQTLVGGELGQPLPIESATGGGAAMEDQLGLFARMRASEAGTAVSGAASRFAGAAPGFLAGAAVDPLALLIGSQVGGQLIGGGAGSLISTVGGAAGLGAIGASMFGGGLGKLLGGGLDKLGIPATEGAGAELGGAALANPLTGIGLALMLGGVSQTGVARAGMTVGGGALAGGAIGSVIEPGIGTAVGAGVGALIGLGTDLFGPGGGSGQSQQSKLRDKYLGVYQEHIAGGLPQLSEQATFQDVFGQELTGAFQDANQTDAQAQQQAVQKAVRNNVQLLKASGYGTTVGEGASKTLTSAIGAAISSPSLKVDPYDIGQVIDTSTQGLETGVGNRFKYQLATSKNAGGDKSALAGDISGIQADYSQAVTDTIKQLEANFNALWSSLQRDPTNKGLQSQLSQVKSEISQARNFGAQINVEDVEQVQQDASQALQQQMQRLSDEASLAAALAGGSRLGQIQAQIAQAKSDYSAAATTPGLSPTQRQSTERQARTQELTARTQYTQQQATELQSRGTVAASVIPSFDPVQQASVALQNATNYYAWVKAHSNAFDPSDINAALAARNQAYLALADAQYQYQTSVISGSFSIAQASNPYNPAAVGGAQVSEGQAQLGIARNLPERQAAQATIIGGQVAIAEAAQQTAQAGFQIREAQQGGDPVAQAYTQIAAAYNAIATSLGPQQTQQALAQLAQAQQTLHQALQQQIVDIGNLKASETNNTLVQDSDRLAAARKALAQALSGHYGAGTVRSDQTAVGQAILQQTNDYVSQRLATIQFQQSTLQVSAQGALQELEGMAKLKDLSVSQRQQIASAMYAIETNQDNTSLFDLAPAGNNIKVPTIYDVRTAAARERAKLRGEHDVGGVRGQDGAVHIGGATVNTTGGALNTHDLAVEQAIKNMHGTMEAGGFGAGNGGDVSIIINVKGKDVGTVADTLDKTLGTRVHHRMRSAGVRGT